MFEKFEFSDKQIRRYYSAAIKDLHIAAKMNNVDVKFRFSYDALLKLAIAVCAKNSLRVKSRKGHHIKLLEMLATILHNKDISLIGNEMRAKRNFDLYGGGILISRKEAQEYFEWTKDVFETIDKIFDKNLKLL